MDGLTFSPVHELSALMLAGQVTSRSLVDAYLARIDAHGARLHAFVATYADEARRAADAADQAIAAGYRLGPFHGIPVVLKDNIDMAGRVTTGGSRHWEHRVSGTTAHLVDRLIAAGLIILGKTHSVEFAMGSFGTNQYMGTPRNPWDSREHRAPGGSSSGTGVAVAAALSPWGVGTDTGGSVRIPASWCGVTALKPTVGRVSTHGVIALANTLDTPGPMCRDVEDCAILYDLMRDTGGPLEGVMAGLKRGIRGLVIARLPEQEREQVEADVLAAYDESLAVLKGLGADIVDMQLPLSFQEIGARTGRIVGAEGYANVGHLVEDPSLPIDDAIRPRILLGKDMRSVEYIRLLREREAHKDAWNRAFRGVDVFALPTTATAAPLLDEIDQAGIASTMTRPANYVDWCAVALPNGFTKKGLPTSLQLACPAFDERTALRTAWAYEQATTWRHQRPALA